ncbi:MAG: FtsK/SpoIIIE domain-containing protein [Deinococcota bacterium]
MAPLPGVQVSTFPVKLGNLEAAQVEKKLDDIAGRLGADSIRGSWLPGSNLYSLELPRTPRQALHYDQITVPEGGILPLLVGVSNGGRIACDDLTRLPHLLVAGQTGSGKSTAMHVILSTLITRCVPSKLRLVLCDPKSVELKTYEGIPHLLTDIITEPAQLIRTLEALIAEMQLRYQRLATSRVRDISAYNKKHPDEPLPRIVCVVDELADAMIVAKKKLEPLLQRLLAQARAAGIHLILATQRVTPEVLTSALKINVPARLALTCDNFHSSKAILDADGAQRLLGAGDAIYKAPDGSSFRVQTPFISDNDIDQAIRKAQVMPKSDFKLELPQPTSVTTTKVTTAKVTTAKQIRLDTKAITKSVQQASSNIEPASDSISQSVQNTAELNIGHALVSSSSVGSKLEEARTYVANLEQVVARDLLEAGIASSDTVARRYLKTFREEGLIGAYDASLRGAPVYQNNQAA